MKINAILPFLIPVVIAGGLISYNELNNNVLLEMLHTTNSLEYLSNAKETQELTQTQQQSLTTKEETVNNFEEENTITPKNENSEFITEHIESQATTAQKSYNCGSKGCFETAFNNCTSAIGIDEILKPYSQKTQYEIVELGETGCKVKTTFNISFFPDWEGKSITCELDNTLSITEAAGLIYQPNGSENLKCQGELLPELKKYGY